ncbi:hypothetical protein ACI2OX_03680 [Bacillus sp. N9]
MINDPLFIHAILSENLKMVELLIAYGVDINLAGKMENYLFTMRSIQSNGRSFNF